MSNLIMSRDHQMWRYLLCAACACGVFPAAHSTAEAQQPHASADPKAAIEGAPGVPSPGVSMRRVAHVDESGQWIEIQYSDGPGTPPSRSASALPPGVIWHAVDAISITKSVAVSDTTDETWVGHNLNSHRLAYHQTTGDGTPIYEYNLPGNPNIVGVASAEDVSLGVVLEQFNSGGASVRAFDADGGNIPLWTYNFGNNFNFNNYRNLDVSADGSIVVAAARDGTAGTTLIVILDGSTGAELNSLTVSSGVLAVELSEDGGRAILSEFATARIIETTNMTTLFSFAVSGGGGYHRLSRDGATAAAGGFNCLAYHEVGGVWSQVYSFSQASNWFGGGLALSANGDTLLIVSHNYITGYVDLTYRVIDLVSAVELAQITTNGTGVFQDTVQHAQSSADGQLFSVISWGTQDNVHPEVQIFDRDLNLVGWIDTPGSPFSVDMTRDGQFVVVGGKAVHANTAGNGSDTYAFRVFEACPADLDDNGEVGAFDLALLLGGWGPCDEPCEPGDPSTTCAADLDGNCEVGAFDLALLLGAWGPCSP